jgi:hypothetical protein
MKGNASKALAIIACATLAGCLSDQKEAAIKCSREALERFPNDEGSINSASSKFVQFCRTPAVENSVDSLGLAVPAGMLAPEDCLRPATRHQPSPRSFMTFADTNPAELMLMTMSAPLPSRTLSSGRAISRTVAVRLAVYLSVSVKNVSS